MMILRWTMLAVCLVSHDSNTEYDNYNNSSVEGTLLDAKSLTRAIFKTAGLFTMILEFLEHPIQVRVEHHVVKYIPLYFIIYYYT